MAAMALDCQPFPHSIIPYSSRPFLSLDSLHKRGDDKTWESTPD